MKKEKSIQLNCFNPPIMLATFLIEVTLAVWVYLRYRTSTVGRLGVAMLICLAIFQMAEYFVCGGLGINSMAWSRAGYVAITALPPLGLHMISELSGVKDWRGVKLGYMIGLMFIAYFAFFSSSIHTSVCAGNYVIFRMQYGHGIAYATYYYGLLLSGLLLAARSIPKTPLTNRKNALKAMIVGYCVFLIPTAIVNTLRPETMAAIPSVMCGFAILYALILTGKVLPLAEPELAIKSIVDET